MAELEVRTSGAESTQVEADTEVLNQEGTVEEQEVTEENSNGAESQEAEQQPKDETEESTGGLQAELDRQTNTEKEVQKDLESKGLNFEELSNEYLEKGELSEESLAKLEQSGYPRALVDSYLDNLNLRAEKFVNEVVSYAGGEQQFDNVKAFVSSQGTEAEQAFNAVLETGNLSLIKSHLNGIKAQMGQSFGTTKPTIMGVGSSNTQVSLGFETKQQLVDAMSDKRYGVDKRYTKEVQEKVLNSDLF
ncbi:capsid assembly protein [uncultured Veillonella sp.]|uniref:capsid assembly protein n=1 Tax=uncultured Veillonella sp. TaxID=159268 RepID=UPI0025E6E21F|nr:hypothetical protein [uncultured Veillonella sp.]